MTPLLMCIIVNMLCFDFKGNIHRYEAMDTDLIFYLQDIECNPINGNCYDRYHSQEVISGKKWACYPDTEIIKNLR